jgi:hypothetical protein
MTSLRPGILTNDSLKDAPLTPEQELAKYAQVEVTSMGDEDSSSNSWTCLVYGPPKSGKTHFAGTAGPRTLYINTGDGLETLRSPGFTKRYPEAKDMLLVNVFEDKGELAAYDKISRAIGHAIEKLRDRFDTIVLDDATSWNYMTMGLAMDNNTQERTKGTARKLRQDSFVKTELSDFNIEMQMTTYWLHKFIRIFKQEGINFLLLAHERHIFGAASHQGAEQPLLKTVPGFTGKSRPDIIPAYFDDIFHSEVVGGGQVYRLDTRGSDKVIAGTRHGGIFHAVEADPNYLKMLERIKKKISAVSTPVAKK